MLAALAFVPPAAVAEGFDNLMGSEIFETNDTMLRSFINYFEGTWVISFGRQRRPRAPIFEPELWNCYQSVLDGMGKTNNACEGFNRAINSMLKHVWEIVALFRALCHRKIVQRFPGHALAAAHPTIF